MRLRIADKLKGLGFQLLAAFWWLCEWVGDKLFGDAAFGWVRAMLVPIANLPWSDIAWNYGIPLLLSGIGFYFFLRGDREKAAENVPLALNDEKPHLALFSSSLRKVAGLDEWVVDIQAKADINSFVVRLDVQEFVSHLDRWDKWRRKITFSKDKIIEGETFYIPLIKWDWPGKDIKWAFWCYEGHDSPDEQIAEAGRLMVSDEVSRCQLVFRSGAGESQTVKFVVLSRYRNNPAECPVLISEYIFDYDSY